MQVVESSIAPTNRVKNLGCWSDGQLKMDSICKTTFFHLYNIRRMRKFLNFECTKVNAFETSRLDFCNNLLYGLPNDQVNKLQRIQNVAARLTCNVGRFEHITLSLCKLHWLPLTIESSLKFFFLYIKPSTVSPHLLGLSRLCS